MLSSENRAVLQCGVNTEAFVSYIQSRHKDLSRAEATWIAAATIASLPALFSENESLLQCLDRVKSEFREAPGGRC